MARQGNIVFDLSKCDHCGLCLKACVGRVIDHAHARVEVEHCILCGHCLAICPRGALSLAGHPLPEEGAGLPLPAHGVSPDAFERLVRGRRTMRAFKDEDIDPGTLRSILELLRYAPTGTNSQGVHMSVLGTRRAVGDFSRGMMGFFQRVAALAPLFLPLIALVLGPRRAKKAAGFSGRYFRRWREGEDVLCHGAPCLLVFHASGSSSTPEQDCLIWAATASLHAETLGLGSCYNGFIVYGLRFHRPSRAFLRMPRGHRAYAALLLGKPALKYLRVPPRAPLRAEFID
jgi:ferredoxin